MHTRSLPALGGLLLILGCTSETTPDVTPAANTEAQVAAPKTPAAEVPIKATTATWIVYEMPG